MPQVVLAFSENVKNHVGYGTMVSEQLDQAYNLLQAGFIPKPTDQRSELQNQTVTSVRDNYIFLNRYFSKAQVIRVLILRVLFLNNPILEVFYFLKALKFKKIKIEALKLVEFDQNQSSLLESKPSVSVIIPTLNRYEYLKDVLEDLEKQDYTQFEVIVCDQSEPVNEAFYDGWNLNIQLIKQEEKALWLARNKCIKRAKGNYILLFDDDSRVELNWISNHLKCIDFFSVQISAGVTYTLVGGGLGKKHSYFHLSDVFDTGNAMVKRDVFEKVGLFDRQFEKQRMGDSEFGLRSLLGGFLIVSNPKAQRKHLKVETGGLRQMGSWDAVRPKNILAPRPIPSVLYLIRKYHSAQEAFLYLIKNIPQSYIPYKYKGNNKAKLLIFSAFPIWLPLAIFSAIKSWKLATLKLRHGPLIEALD